MDELPADCDCGFSLAGVSNEDQYGHWLNDCSVVQRCLELAPKAKPEDFGEKKHPWDHSWCQVCFNAYSSAHYGVEPATGVAQKCDLMNLVSHRAEPLGAAIAEYISDHSEYRCIVCGREIGHGMVPPWTSPVAPA